MTGTHTQNPIYSRYRNSYSDPYILQIQEYTQNPINSRYMNSYSEPYILQVQEYILRTLYTPGTRVYSEPYILQVHELILRTLYTPGTRIRTQNPIYSSPGTAKFYLYYVESVKFNIQNCQDHIFDEYLQNIRGSTASTGVHFHASRFLFNLVPLLGFNTLN